MSCHDSEDNNPTINEEERKIKTVFRWISQHLMLELWTVTSLSIAVPSSCRCRLCSHFYCLESEETSLVVIAASRLAILSVFWPMCKEVPIPACWVTVLFTEA